MILKMVMSLKKLMMLLVLLVVVGSVVIGCVSFNYVI